MGEHQGLDGWMGGIGSNPEDYQEMRTILIEVTVDKEQND